MGDILFWYLWAEGHVTGKHGALQLNTEPIQAGTFSEAIQKLATIHPEGHLFEKTFIGWTFKGCSIFDNEVAARIARG